MSVVAFRPPVAEVVKGGKVAINVNGSCINHLVPHPKKRHKFRLAGRSKGSGGGMRPYAGNGGRNVSVTGERGQAPNIPSTIRNYSPTPSTSSECSSPSAAAAAAAATSAKSRTSAATSVRVSGEELVSSARRQYSTAAAVAPTTAGSSSSASSLSAALKALPSPSSTDAASNSSGGYAPSIQHQGLSLLNVPPPPLDLVNRQMQSNSKDNGRKVGASNTGSSTKYKGHQEQQQSPCDLEMPPPPTAATSGHPSLLQLPLPTPPEAGTLGPMAGSGGSSAASLGATASAATSSSPETTLIHGLEAVLRSQGCYETEQGLDQRRELLKELNLLLRRWIHSVSLSMGMHWQDTDKLGGRIITYGSYMLGISHQGADIDALCVVPQHITRDKYFDTFQKMLENDPEVSDLRAVPTAYVPVIKMKYTGIEIDMTFARLNLPSVPPATAPPPPPPPSHSSCSSLDGSQLLHCTGTGAGASEEPMDMLVSDKELERLEPKCLTSLNGYRSTIELKRLVPNLQVFRMALRAIKLWAKSQGLYSNILGYLGGFSWAVLVANVCMMNPHSNTVEIIHKFFHLYSTWPWPKPVTLVELKNGSSAAAQQPPATFQDSYHHLPHPHPAYQSMTGVYYGGGGGGHPHYFGGGGGYPYGGVGSGPFHHHAPAAAAPTAAAGGLSSWNPEVNIAERFQAMPIITPTFPHINSSFNVSANTKELIRQKMLVAAGTCDKIMQAEESWDTLFKTCHMFHEYEHFLFVIASASEHLMWFGLIESKIRHLVTTIEKECSPTVSSARIWPKPFSQTKTTPERPATISHHQLWFIGIQFKNPAVIIRDYKRIMNNFEDTLKIQAKSFYQSDMRIEAHSVLKSELRSHLSESEIQEIVSSQSQKKTNSTNNTTSSSSSSSSSSSTSSPSNNGNDQQSSSSRSSSSMALSSSSSLPPSSPSPLPPASPSHSSSSASCGSLAAAVSAAAAAAAASSATNNDHHHHHPYHATPLQPETEMNGSAAFFQHHQPNNHQFNHQPFIHNSYANATKNGSGGGKKGGGGGGSKPQQQPPSSSHHGGAMPNMMPNIQHTGYYNNGGSVAVSSPSHYQPHQQVYNCEGFYPYGGVPSQQAKSVMERTWLCQPSSGASSRSGGGGGAPRTGGGGGRDSCSVSGSSSRNNRKQQRNHAISPLSPSSCSSAAQQQQQTCAKEVVRGGDGDVFTTDADASKELMSLLGRREGGSSNNVSRCHLMSVGSDRSMDQGDELSPTSAVAANKQQRQNYNNNNLKKPNASAAAASGKGGGASGGSGQRRGERGGGSGSNSSSVSSAGGGGAGGGGGSCSSASGIDDYNSSLESDHGRSVSFSSDKFPPSSLVHARIHHGGEGMLPFSPAAGGGHGGGAGGFSVPPPNHPSFNGGGSSSCTGSPSSATSSTASRIKSSPNDKRMSAAAKSGGSLPRLSSGEICDVPTPRPVQNLHFQPVRFNFNSSSLHMTSASAAAASDSVFH